MGIVSAMFRETKRLFGGGIGTAKVFPADRGTGQWEAFSADGDAVCINICLVARKKCILQKKVYLCRIIIWGQFVCFAWD